MLADIERGAADANLDRYLDDAERMLEEIKGHDFSDTNVDAEDELINAEDGQYKVFYVCYSMYNVIYKTNSV